MAIESGNANKINGATGMIGLAIVCTTKTCAQPVNESENERTPAERETALPSCHIGEEIRGARLEVYI